jgi:hypothetical protein
MNNSFNDNLKTIISEERASQDRIDNALREK